MIHDAVVIGSGPNGLAAAVTLARTGLRVLVLEARATAGGGLRTMPLPGHPELMHDVCSAVHPLALASPFLRGFDLAARGVDLAVPEVSFAHPLDGPRGPRAGIAFRDLAATVARLNEAGSNQGTGWQRTFGPLAASPDDVAGLLLGDRRTLLTGMSPDRMRVAAHLGAQILRKGLLRPGRSDDVAHAMFSGLATHAITPVPSLAAAGTALLLGTLAHGAGWPIPRGGSQGIADALMADLIAHGGRIDVGREVRTRADLPPARAYVFDTSPRTVARVLGGSLDGRVVRALERFRYGSAAAKVDFVLSGPVPWASPDVGRAATVHVGGSGAEVAHAEGEIAAGRHADRPVVLVSDPVTGDPGRGTGGLRALWTYAHVPAGSTRDVTEQVTRQIERFAPGFRDVIVSAHCVPAAGLEAQNANYVGGDIAAGAITPWQMLARPRLAMDPFHLGEIGLGGMNRPERAPESGQGPGPAAPRTAGVFICSAATPPGPGVHGMGGWSAARSVLERQFGVRNPPRLAPQGPAA